MPFVDDLELRIEPDGPPGQYRPDAKLILVTPTGRVPFYVEVKRTHLTYAIADAVTAHARKVEEAPLLLAAPYVPPGIAEQLAEAGINYVDEAGNYRVAVGERYFAERTGQKPDKRPKALQGARLAGHQVIFTLLARPEYVDLTIRELAEKANVGKTAAGDALKRLEARGLIGKRKPRRILEPRELMDRWLAGYTTYVRPRLFLGAYRTPHGDPDDLEAAIEDAAPDVEWAWGGGAAADRLTGYYRGEETVLHVDDEPDQMLRAIRALRAEDGPLRVFGVPGPVAFEGAAPRTVHPLLVYTELYASGGERARDAAREIGERYLEELL